MLMMWNRAKSCTRLDAGDAKIMRKVDIKEDCDMLQIIIGFTNVTGVGYETQY